MRDNWLPNRVFKSYEDIVDHCCFAWNSLIVNLGALSSSEGMIGRIGFDQRALV